MDSQIHWFALEQGDYVELKPRSDGVIRSRIFPGLWLDIRALLAGDEDKVSRDEWQMCWLRLGDCTGRKAREMEVFAICDHGEQCIAE